MVDLVQWVEDNNAQLDQGVVYDRHRLISEPIYGTVLRPEPSRNFANIHWMIAAMHGFYSKKPVLIYCIPPKDVVLENVGSLPKGTTPEQASKVYDLYCAKAAADIGCQRAYLYDYTNTPLRLLIGIISREEMF